MDKKKVGIIAAVIIVIAAIAGLIWYFNGGSTLIKGSSKDKVYVDSVKNIMNSNSGVNNRFSGLVEPQETWDVKKNEDKTVKELMVEEGQTVEEGTPLFEYDTEELKSQLAQAQLDLEGVDNEISNYNGQINELKTERNGAPESEKFQYTTQIQTLENQIKQSEFSKESKRIEIQNLQESIDNSVVVSKIAGIVKSISETGYDPYTSENLPYISVLATGDYRVKGTINEQNVYEVQEGQPVIIRSRVDETKTWTGSISKVDTDNQVTNENNYYMDAGSSETATKYPFYIELDIVEGLILGQHVFIEMDLGQAEEKEGIWLYESYIVIENENQDQGMDDDFSEVDPEELDLENIEPDETDPEEGTENLLDETDPEEGADNDEENEGIDKTDNKDLKAFVWVSNSKNKLEKRSVKLGEYDAVLFQYEIVSGLDENDLIAMPMSSLYEGVTTVTSMEDVDFTSPMYEEEGMSPMDEDEGALPDGMNDDMNDDMNDNIDDMNDFDDMDDIYDEDGKFTGDEIGMDGLNLGGEGMNPNNTKELDEDLEVRE